MTELETIERARMYLEKLANGIDPLTDLPVPEGDVINQVRISRCLFFTADVLRRVAENGGITPPPRGRKKSSFTATQEQLQEVRFSREPLRITELCKRITDAAAQEGGKRLTNAVVLEWLESVGMLEKQEDAEGKRSRRPTEAGRQIGIVEEERTGTYGTYIAVLYTEEAQHFIVDNLDAALALRQSGG
ncbi:MAG: hypothetical protein LUG45_01820 [Clostridiales bacterium]|nr:hypothetical protein [Clostridiales bacterium]